MQVKRKFETEKLHFIFYSPCSDTQCEKKAVLVCNDFLPQVRSSVMSHAVGACLEI